MAGQGLDAWRWCSRNEFDVSVWLFLRPAVFVAVLVVCLLFNLLSVFIPAWHATRRPIAEVLGGE